MEIKSYLYIRKILQTLVLYGPICVHSKIYSHCNKLLLQSVKHFCKQVLLQRTEVKFLHRAFIVSEILYLSKFLYLILKLTNDW